MTTYHVTGMTCEHCVRAVTTEVEALPGVTGATVDLTAGTVDVAGEATRAEIAAAVDEAGYSLT